MILFFVTAAGVWLPSSGELLRQRCEQKIHEAMPGYEELVPDEWGRIPGKCFQWKGAPEVVFEDVDTASRIRGVEQRSRMAGAGTTPVDREVQEFCGPGSSKRFRAAFSLEVQAEQAIIHHHLRLDFPWYTPPRRDRELLAEARACVPFVASLFERAGVRLDLVIDSRAQALVGLPHLTVRAIDGAGRSHTDGFFFLGQPEFKYENLRAACAGQLECLALLEQQRKNRLCLMLAHETGHALGWKDEYPEDSCPARRVRASPRSDLPESLMAHSDAALTEFAGLAWLDPMALSIYPDQIDELFRLAHLAQLPDAHTPQ